MFANPIRTEPTDTMQTWLPEEPLHISGDAWLAPEKNCYFFCDLHADADAFLRSLILSGLITSDSRIGSLCLTEKAQNAQVIIGGDCFDKGPSNLKLFQLLNDLRQTDIDLILLAGNHDIRVLAGLIAIDHQEDYRQAHFVVRMGRKTVALFKEIYDLYELDKITPELNNAEAIEAISPSQAWYDNFAEHTQQDLSPKQLKKEIKQVRKKQMDIFDACLDAGMEPKHLYQAIQQAKLMFIDPDGEFSWFLQELQLIHRNGSYLFCHAGLDDQIAEHFAPCHSEPCEQLNQVFQNTLKNGQIFEIYYSAFGNVVRTKYRDKDFAFTEKGASILKQSGIFAIVNGHRSHLDGQKLYVREGLLNFECDTELNLNCRQKSGLNCHGESVTIFATDGTVNAFCSDMEAPKQFHPLHLNPAKAVSG